MANCRRERRGTALGGRLFGAAALPAMLGLLGAALVAACGDDDTESSSTGGTTATSTGLGGSGGSTTSPGGGGAGATGAQGGADPCPRLPAAADRPRKVLVSHPYTADSDPSDSYEVLDLSATGELTRPGQTITLRRTTYGTMAFTPDGKVGIVAQPDDQTLGVVAISDEGEVTVTHAGYEPPVELYPDSVVMDPSGHRVYVVDGNWRNNGGGVYAVTIECDGTLGQAEKLFESKLASGLVLLPGDPSRAVLAAVDALGSPTDLDLQLLSWGAAPAWLDGADAFPDDDAIVASLAVTSDGRYALIGDNSEYSGVDNRIGVVRVEDDSLVALAPLSPILDPVSIVASPYGNAALVASGYGDELIVLSYDAADATTPFAEVGPPSYQGAEPQLPGSAVQVEVGSLRGMVLVTEVEGVRRLSFQANGTVVDHGLLAFGGGVENIPGAIGVQP